MKNTPSPVDPRHVPSPLIASLVTALTLSLLLAWNPQAPRATETDTAAANAVATAPEAAPDNTNGNLGPGCADGCLVSD